MGRVILDLKRTDAKAVLAPILAPELLPEQMIEIYRLMYLSRRVDDREILLKRQQKIFFQVSGAGHEALLVAAGLALKPGYDWFYPYYRDRALCLALGNTPEEQFLQGVGAAADIASGGRQMPSHWSNPVLHIVSQSSSTTTQCLQAVGCAEAGRYFSRHPEAAAKPDGDYREFKNVEFHGDEVVFVSLGEGATSQGEFWESLNTASNARLPVLFVVEDNEYAISVPVEVNTPGGNISRLVANFPNFHFAEIDGTDPVASYFAFQEAVAWCRSGNGPALVHGHVVRPYLALAGPTTIVSTVPLPNWRPTTCATPCRSSRCGCCVREFWMPRRLIGWKRKSMRKSDWPRSGLCVRRCLRSRRSPGTFILKTSILPALRLKPSPPFPPIHRRGLWPISSTAA